MYRQIHDTSFARNKLCSPKWHTVWYKVANWEQFAVSLFYFYLWKYFLLRENKLFFFYSTVIYVAILEIRIYLSSFSKTYFSCHTEIVCIPSHPPLLKYQTVRLKVFIFVMRSYLPGMSTFNLVLVMSLHQIVSSWIGNYPSILNIQ